MYKILIEREFTENESSASTAKNPTGQEARKYVENTKLKQKYRIK